MHTAYATCKIVAHHEV